MNRPTYRQTMALTGFAYFILLALTLGLQLCAAGAVNAWAPALARQSWYLWAVSYGPLYGVAFPAFLLFMHRFVPSLDMPQPERALRIEAGSFALLLLFCMGVTYLLNFVSVFMSLGVAALKGSAVQNPLEQIQSGSGMGYNLLFGCVLAPVGEEILFRWMLFKKIGAYGERQYVLLGGLLFALYHMNLFQIPYAFALGAVLCYLYCKTRRLTLNIALHMSINLIGFFAGPLAMRAGWLSVLFFLFMAGCITAAVLLWTRWRRQLYLAPGSLPLPEHPARAALCNVGMLGYMAGCLAVTVYQTLR